MDHRHFACCLILYRLTLKKIAPLVTQNNAKTKIWDRDQRFAGFAGIVYATHDWRVSPLTCHVAVAGARIMLSGRFLVTVF